jgi:hypothetical protein
MRLLTMPRFYFHLRNDMSVNDEEGIELPNVESVRVRAEQYALDMSAASVLEQRKINLHHRIEVADEAGQTVLTIEFGDVVTIESNPPR